MIYVYNIYIYIYIYIYYTYMVCILYIYGMYISHGDVQLMQYGEKTLQLIINLCSGSDTVPLMSEVPIVTYKVAWKSGWMLWFMLDITNIIMVILGL